MMPSQQDLEFDAVVVGDGPAGCATAIRLAQLDYRVGMVSRGRVSRHYESLEPSTRPFLQRLGAWDAFTRLQFPECDGTVSHWKTDELTFSDSCFTPYQQGYRTDRDSFDRMLRQVAATQGVIRVDNVRLVDIEPTQPFRLRLRNAEMEWEVRCQWVVDATGRSSAVARRLGVVRRCANDQISLAGMLRSSSQANASMRLHIETIPDGWWYAIQLPDGRTYCVLQTDRDCLPNGSSARRDFWTDRLQQAEHIRRLVEPRTPAHNVRVVSSDSSILRRCTGHNWMAVGDAAIAMDPLSGNGITRALRTGIKAAESLHAGTEEAITAYRQLIDDMAADCLVNTASLYRQQTRWNHPFWRRRQQLFSDRSKTSSIPSAHPNEIGV